MLAAGEWRATGVAADPSTIGFHLSALYSPVGWLSWEQIARSWEAARGNDEAIRAFRNTILGETWIETGEAPDWQRLYDRRERWAPGTVPKGGLFLTAGADIQKDRIEVDVWAWGRGLEVIVRSGRGMGAVKRISHVEAKPTRYCLSAGNGICPALSSSAWRFLTRILAPT